MARRTRSMVSRVRRIGLATKSNAEASAISPARRRPLRSAWRRPSALMSVSA